MKTAILLFSFILSSLTLLAQPGGIPTSSSEFFSDPEWRKGFLGSYEILAQVEPSISPEERELLQDVLELMQNNINAAVVRLQTEVNESSSAALNFILANLQFQNGNTQAAIAQYQAAIEKEKSFLRAHKNLGLMFIQDNQLKEGVKHLSRSIELGAREARAYGLLGYSFLNMENPVAAEKAYSSAIIMEPENKQWKLGLLQALMNQQNYGAALSTAKVLLEQDPEDVSLWKIQANALIGMNEPLKAANALEVARLLGEKSPAVLSLLGDIYMNQQMYGLARDTYLYSLNHNRDARDFTGFLRAARLLYRTQNYNESQEVVNALGEKFTDAEIAREDELELLTLKAQLQRKLGEEEEAAKTLESIVERDGTRGEALIELAEYYWSNEQQELALIKLDQAASLEKYRFDALVKKAQLLVSRRNYDDAVSLLRQALELKQSPRIERFYEQVQKAAASAND